MQRWNDDHEKDEHCPYQPEDNRTQTQNCLGLQLFW